MQDVKDAGNQQGREAKGLGSVGQGDGWVQRGAWSERRVETKSAALPVFRPSSRIGSRSSMSTRQSSTYPQFQSPPPTAISSPGTTLRTPMSLGEDSNPTSSTNSPPSIPDTGSVAQASGLMQLLTSPARETLSTSWRCTSCLKLHQLSVLISTRSALSPIAEEESPTHSDDSE